MFAYRIIHGKGAVTFCRHLRRLLLKRPVLTQLAVPKRHVAQLEESFKADRRNFHTDGNSAFSDLKGLFTEENMGSISRECPTVGRKGRFRKGPVLFFAIRKVHFSTTERCSPFSTPLRSRRTSRSRTLRASSWSSIGPMTGSMKSR